MNPQDLLYTNQFENTNIISSKNLGDHTKHYKQYQKHIHKLRNPTEEYLNNNTRRNDIINTDKRKAHPMPSPDNSNIKPIFSSAINDIVDHKYSKSTRTVISIYSDDRDKTKYITPNNYIINMGKDFTNVYKIKLIDIDIPAIIPPINRRNNVIKWIYPTNEVVETCNYSILPFKPTVSIPSNSDLFISTALENEFSASIPAGFYTTITLSNEMENNMNAVLFNQGDTKDPYYITHNFEVDINPHKSITSIINRVNNIDIAGIQTVKLSNNEYSTSSNKVSCYIILKEQLDTTHKHNPIIISGIPFTNNGVIDMLNLTEFYDKEIVPDGEYYSKYSEIKTIPGAPTPDTGTCDVIPGKEAWQEYCKISKTKYDCTTYMAYCNWVSSYSTTSGPSRYYKYELTIGTDSFTKYDKSVYIYPSQNDFVVFDKNLLVLLTSGNEYNIRDFTNITNSISSNIISRPVVGKARAFALKNKFDNTRGLKLDKTNTDMSCIDPRISILSLLGWNISKYKTDTIDPDNPFKFIHMNTDIPVSNILDVELLQTGDYIFKSIPFIFLKLSFPTLPDDICSGQLVRSTSNLSSKLSTEYYYPVLSEHLDPPISESSSSDTGVVSCKPTSSPCIVDNYIENKDTTYEILEMDDRHLFAKINISSIQGTSYNIHNYDFEYVFYDNPLNNVNQIKIELLSPDGRILELNQDHNITLEIMESIDVLKETLLDTKHNNIVTTGAK